MNSVIARGFDGSLGGYAEALHRRERGVGGWSMLPLALILLPTAFHLVRRNCQQFAKSCPRANSPLLFDQALPRHNVLVKASTRPDAVLAAMLDALHAGDVSKAYDLLSRVRRMEIEELARNDVRQTVTFERAHSAMFTDLTCNCPGLLRHESAEVVASLGEAKPPRGRLPMWRYRVKVDGRHFFFQLSRQSEADPKGDPRDIDGFEDCWFIRRIWIDEDGGSRDGKRSGSSPLKALSQP